MFHSKFRKIAIILTSLIFASFLFLFGLFVYYIPDAPISLAVFKMSYSLFPFKKSFLEFYSPADRNFGVNTRPYPADNTFLLQRIEATNDESEIAAIMHYFALQAKVREYDIFINSSDRVKPSIINQLIKELDDNSDLSSIIMLLETTRSGKRIGKGTIGFKGPYYVIRPDTEEKGKEFHRQLEIIVKPKYQQWWNSSSSWEEKKNINPLADTNIKVSECCG